MQLWSQQGNMHYIRIKAHESSSSYLDSLLKFEFGVCP